MIFGKDQEKLNWYGRRRGYKLRPKRQALIDDRLPDLRLEIPKDGSLNLMSAFSRSVKDFWLEVGFGGGEHLAVQAGANPDIGFIGCEPYINGIASHLSVIDREKLTNIRIFDDDARKLFKVLPDSILGRVYALFLDPWPKKRHHRRRFISEETVDSLIRIMKDNAQLRIASDHMGYISWVLEHLSARQELEWLVQSKQDWTNPTSDWVATRYEKKAKMRGCSSAYLCFTRRPRKKSWVYDFEKPLKNH